MMKLPTRFTSIGGQAVIEGVMMRSPHFVAVAVRKPNQRITIKNFSYVGVAARYPILKKPILRGITTLVESMVQGIEALGFAAGVAAEEESAAKNPSTAKAATGSASVLDPTHASASAITIQKPSAAAKEELSSWAIFTSIATAFVLGMGLFVALPHLLTVLITSSPRVGLTAQSPIFHLIDGCLKMAILLSYVYLISLMKDIKRVFQYHGAEHKSIFTFEAGEALTVANARKYPTLHPRCGTSFLLFLVLISIAVFSIVFPLLGLTQLSTHAWVNHAAMVGVKMVLMLPVAGLAYEVIKACACRMENPLFKAIIWPGLVLQKLTTREPDDSQLEVALASLRQVLRMEKDTEESRAAAGVGRTLSTDGPEFGITEVADLEEIQWIAATVAEFPEI